jgi:glycosyltransferase involved in cell wall biosynthesis
MPQIEPRSVVAAGPGAPLVEALPPPPEITVLIPVLDEAATVEELATRIASTLDGAGRSFEIVFVDDGSRDGTSARVLAARTRDGRVKLVRLRRNFGKAAALTAGLDLARGELIVTMDGDLQDDPEEMPRLIEALEAGPYDLVSGWKRDRQDPLHKTLPSRIFNGVTRRLARVDLHDFNCGFKVYRRQVLEEVPVYGELHRYIPVLASRRGFRVGELAVRHHARRSGVSKYGWDRLYKGLLDLLTVLFITKYTRRPLHLFGLIGLVSFGAGFVINAWLAFLWAFRDESLSQRPLLFLGVLLMLAGLQVLTTGLLAEMTTHKTFRRTDSYSVKEIVD